MIDYIPYRALLIKANKAVLKNANCHNPNKINRTFFFAYAALTLSQGAEKQGVFSDLLNSSTRVHKNNLRHGYASRGLMSFLSK